jgi:hypothetical protein
LILEQVPTSVISGDTWRFTLEFADYPAPTWDLTFYAENKDSTFSQAAVDSGSNHAFVIDAANTALIKDGKYKWMIRATDGAIVETISSGWIDVVVNPAAAGNKDRRSWARRTLDALEATLEGRASSDQIAMSVGGRSISRMSLAELREWRDILRGEVRTEEQGERAGLGRDIRVRFGRA